MRHTLTKGTVAAVVTAAGSAALAVSLLPANNGISVVPDGASAIAPALVSYAGSDTPAPFRMRGGGFTLYGRLSLADRAPVGLSDVNGDGVVEDVDALSVLSGWGDCPPAPEDCGADIDGNGRVDAADLVQVVTRWGSAATERARPRPEELAAAGLTDADWDRFLEVLESGSDAQRRNWICWMRHSLGERSPDGDCPGPDPISVRASRP